MIFSSFTATTAAAADFFSPLIAVSSFRRGFGVVDFRSDFGFLLVALSLEAFDPIAAVAAVDLPVAMLLPSLLFNDFDFFSLFSHSSFVFVDFLVVNFLFATDLTDDGMGRCLEAVFGFIGFFTLGLSDFANDPANLVWGFFECILLKNWNRNRKRKELKRERKRSDKIDKVVILWACNRTSSAVRLCSKFPNLRPN